MPGPKRLSSKDQRQLMTAYMCVKDKKTLREQVGILDRFGFSDKQIGRVCGATTDSVRTSRSARKSPQAKAGKARPRVATRK